MPDERTFVDTNIVVYAHDRSAGRKQEVASSLVDGLWTSGLGCLSVQVLQELFVTLTRKVPQPLSHDTAIELVTDFSRWDVHAPTAQDVIAAATVQRRHRLSFWDAMIIQSATALGCSVLYSEDLKSGQRYDGLTVVNPLATAS